MRATPAAFLLLHLVAWATAGVTPSPTPQGWGWPYRAFYLVRDDKIGWNITRGMPIGQNSGYTPVTSKPTNVVITHFCIPDGLRADGIVCDLPIRRRFPQNLTALASDPGPTHWFLWPTLPSGDWLAASGQTIDSWSVAVPSNNATWLPTRELGVYRFSHQFSTTRLPNGLAGGSCYWLGLYAEQQQFGNALNTIYWLAAPSLNQTGQQPFHYVDVYGNYIPNANLARPQMTTTTAPTSTIYYANYSIVYLSATIFVNAVATANDTQAIADTSSIFQVLPAEPSWLPVRSAGSAGPPTQPSVSPVPPPPPSPPMVMTPPPPSPPAAASDIWTVGSSAVSPINLTRPTPPTAPSPPWASPPAPTSASTPPPPLLASSVDPASTTTPEPSSLLLSNTAALLLVGAVAFLIVVIVVIVVVFLVVRRKHRDRGMTTFLPPGAVYSDVVPDGPEAPDKAALVELRPIRSGSDVEASHVPLESDDEDKEKGATEEI